MNTEDLNDKDFCENEWLVAASENNVFDFLNEEAEDIYSLEDGKPLD